MFRRAILLGILVFVSPRAGFANMLYDDFSSLARSQQIWNSYLAGSGPTLVQTDGVVRMSIPAGTTGAGFGIGYESVFRVDGNFDVQVDYRLVQWPSQNGTRIGLIAVTPVNFGYNYNYDMQRNSLGRFEYGGIYPSEDYSTNFNATSDIVSTSALSGSLRLVRSGTVVSGLYKDGSTPTWTLLTQATDPSSASMQILLQAWSHDYAFNGQTTVVEFDNFRVNSGLVVPEPNSLVLSILATTFGLPLLIRRSIRR